MRTRLISGSSAVLAGLLGTALLVAAPAGAQSGQQKWWTPREGRPERVERGTPARVERNRNFGMRRGEQRVWRQIPRYGRFYRDVIVLRDGYRGPQYRAYRYWFPPYVQRNYIYVRPVRYWMCADVRIGGVRISASLHHGDRSWYGCNFCDARFGTYDDWAVHVAHCDHAPRAYRVQTRPWDDGLDRYHDRGWRNAGDDEGWEYGHP